MNECFRVFRDSSWADSTCVHVLLPYWLLLKCVFSPFVQPGLRSMENKDGAESECDKTVRLEWTEAALCLTTAANVHIQKRQNGNTQVSQISTKPWNGVSNIHASASCL